MIYIVWPFIDTYQVDWVETSIIWLEPNSCDLNSIQAWQTWCCNVSQGLQPYAHNPVIQHPKNILYSIHQHNQYSCSHLECHTLTQADVKCKEAIVGSFVIWTDHHNHPQTTSVNHWSSFLTQWSVAYFVSALSPGLAHRLYIINFQLSIDQATTIQSLSTRSKTRWWMSASLLHKLVVWIHSICSYWNMVICMMNN